MFDAVLYFFALCLMLSGLFFIFYLIFAFFLTGVGEGFFVFVDGFEDDSELEKRIYSAYMQINMLNFGEKRPVYVLDRDLSFERKEELRQSIAPFGKVVFVECSELRFEED